MGKTRAWDLGPGTWDSDPLCQQLAPGMEILTNSEPAPSGGHIRDNQGAGSVSEIFLELLRTFFQKWVVCIK